MTRRGAMPLVGLVIAFSIGAPAHAARGGPTQIVPAKTKPRRGLVAPGVDTSEGGTKQGALEITLGSVLLGLTGVLIGRGIWEIPRAKTLEDACAAGTTSDPSCSLAHPGRTGRISAALSLGFAVPIGVAGSLLLAKGIRIRRDHRAWHRAHEVALRPVAGRRGFGLALEARF